MEPIHLGAKVFALTGSLHPSGTATAADLLKARSAVAAAVHAGVAADGRPPQLAAAIDHSSGLRFAQLDAGARRIFSAVKTGPAAGFISSSPLTTVFSPATPAWARGMAVDALGPFQDVGGPIFSWVHIPLPLPHKVNLKYGGQVVAVVSILGTPTAGKTSYPLTRGSFWIDAQLLAAGSPASSWTGFRVKGGTLTVGAHQVVSGEIVLDAAAKLTLDAELDPPPAAAPISGPGADASLVAATLPAHVTISGGKGGVGITALGDLGVTAYGASASLTKGAQAPLYNAELAALLVPCDVVGPADFSFATVRSTLFAPAGQTKILEGGWVLPVAITTASQLGAASGAGAVGLVLGPGASATWTGSDGPVPLRASLVVAAPGQLTVFSKLIAKPRTATWRLWNGVDRASTLAFSIPPRGVLHYVSASTPVAGESLIADGATVAHTDRPVSARGLRVAASMPTAVMIIIQTPAFPAGLLLIEGAAALPPGAQPAAFALENAFIEALPPQLLIAGGTLQADTVAAGALLFYFGLTAFAPTLPDPYAASIGLLGNPPPRSAPGQTPPSPEPLGALISSVRWSAPPTPLLSFELIFSQAAAGVGHLASVSEAGRGRGPGIRLLDVSSHADQFGVSWSPTELSSVQSDGLLLTSDGVYTSLFTVSAISWEPMVDDDRLPHPAIPRAPSDGVPSQLNVATVKLAPIAPLPLMRLQQQSVAAGNPVSFVGSLPFGLVAEVLDDKGAKYDFVRPQFDGYRGGHQIALTPALAGQITNPEFAGRTVLVDPYASAVLSADVATIFRDAFDTVKEPRVPGVPVLRYDLSGYGASLFSEWIQPHPLGTDVLKVQFVVWVGRTAYEVVQVQSIIYPWGIKVVRTITIQRLSGGTPLRKDSGWQAATPGTFDFPSLDANQFNGAVHAGPVVGVFNVRNIRDNGKPFDIDGIVWVPVLFDADVELKKDNPVISGSTRDVFVPCRDMTGYLQLGPNETLVTRTQLAELLEQRGATSGPVACTVNVGKAGQQMKVRLVEVSATGAGQTAVFVAALRGTPVLPRDGQWSVGLRKGAQAPQALDPQAAVPLIQRNGDDVWHFADPTDILSLGSPQFQYGYLQGTSTQKTFFARPQIKQGSSKVSIPQAPRLADVGSLLGATGIFPDLAKALAFPGAQELALGALGSDTLSLNSLPPFTINQPPLTLVDFDVVKVVLVYEDRSAPGNPGTKVTFKLDPAGSPRWSIDFAKFTFVLVSPFGDVNDPLLQVVGSAHADADHAPSLGELKVVYGNILSAVQEIFSKLNELASFLPGNKSFLDVSLSDGKLTIRDKFALPTLPLGLGDITNVALDLGVTMTMAPLSMDFTAGIASPDQPFQWLVSPLSGTGCVQVGFHNGDPTLLIQAGIGVGLAIDVGIASGSASIVLALQVDNTVKPFEIKVILTGQASVDVLGGLASASLMLSAALAIIPALPDITLVGSVAVGIHISICWVINIDFDGSWQFSQTLTA